MNGNHSIEWSGFLELTMMIFCGILLSDGFNCSAVAMMAQWKATRRGCLVVVVLFAPSYDDRRGCASNLLRQEGV
jgi:hypothetical protein